MYRKYIISYFIGFTTVLPVFVNTLLKMPGLAVCW